MAFRRLKLYFWLSSDRRKIRLLRIRTRGRVGVSEALGPGRRFRFRSTAPKPSKQVAQKAIPNRALQSPAEKRSEAGVLQRNIHLSFSLHRRYEVYTHDDACFAIFCGIPAFLQQEDRTHILSETISTAWHQPELEKRTVQGARILRDVYEATPEQKPRFESVVASRDGDVCYSGRNTDRHPR